jgi:hypothetical protein
MLKANLNVNHGNAAFYDLTPVGGLCIYNIQSHIFFSLSFISLLSVALSGYEHEMVFDAGKRVFFSFVESKVSFGCCKS